MATSGGAPDAPKKSGPAAPAVVPAALALAPLGPPARALLTPTHTASAYIGALVAAGLLKDAVRATAFLLPRREALWWAARCVRSAPAAADPKAGAVLGAVETWAAEPTDAHRRAALAAAEAAGVGSPAGAVGVAVFLVDGSLAPPKQPPVPPAPHLAPTTAANAVLLAAVASEPERATERLEQFIALGAEVAAGRDRWTEPTPARTRAGAAGPPGAGGGPGSPPRRS